MREKIARRFSSWKELREEWEANLKNFGLFLPGEFPLQLRQKVELELFLPQSNEPISARAEVVANFPGGIAFHIEESAQWLKELEEKIQSAEMSTAEEVSEETNIKEQTGAEESEGLINETEPLEKQLSEEEVEKIEKKVTLSGSDLSNLYLAVRRLSKMEKIQLAKRGNRKILSILIQEGDRMLFRFLIQNPHLTVAEVLQLLKHPAITTEIITELARNPAWLQNEEVKYQLVIHPKTPLPTALSLLNALNQKQLGAIAKSQHIKAQLKSNALKLLLKRQSTNT